MCSVSPLCLCAPLGHCVWFCQNTRCNSIKKRIRMRKALALIGGCLLLTFVTGLQAEEDQAYKQIMKNVGATFGSLGKNVQAKNGEAAAEDAKKLAGLFKEVEAFWARATRPMPLLSLKQPRRHLQRLRRVQRQTTSSRLQPQWAALVRTARAVMMLTSPRNSLQGRDNPILARFPCDPGVFHGEHASRRGRLQNAMESALLSQFRGEI